MFLFSRMDERDLVARGLLTRSTPQGWRNIHKRLTNGFGDAENADIPLIPLRDLARRGIHGIESVPDRMVSEATLKYVGFKPEVSRYLWACWCKWDAKRHPRTNFYQLDEFTKGQSLVDMTFAHFVVIWVKQRTELFNPRSTDPRAAWYQCLDMCGFAAEFTSFVMDPFFDMIRVDESCLFWIITTLDTRFRFLRSVAHTSKLRSEELRDLRARGLWRVPKSVSSGRSHGGSPGFDDDDDNNNNNSNNSSNNKNNHKNNHGKNKRQNKSKAVIKEDPQQLDEEIHVLYMAARKTRLANLTPQISDAMEAAALTTMCNSSTGMESEPTSSDSDEAFNWGDDVQSMLAGLLGQNKRMKKDLVEEGYKCLPPRP